MAELSEAAFAALEAQVQRAEHLYRGGDYRAALDTYSALLRDRLASSGSGSVAHLRAADLVVIERLADLSVLCGMIDAADDLIGAIVAITRSAGNNVAADYAQLKRVEISLETGTLEAAFKQLRDLEGRIGDLHAIDMSSAGFARWEKQTAWYDLAAADREVQFSRVYYVFVRLLAGMGEYRQAICAAERSEVYTGSRAIDLARQARIPLALAHASALFELGEIAAADGLLERIRRQVDETGRPGWRVAWLEAKGRIELARGVFASALDRFGDVLQLCRAGGFRRAETTAHLNRAHVFILVNRVRDASEHLDEAEHNAASTGDVSALARVSVLRSLAEARRQSLTEGVSLELSVTETLRRRARAEPAAPAAAVPLEIPHSSNFLALFDDRALQIQWLLAQGALDDAGARLEALRQSFGTSQSRLIRGRLCALGGLLSYYRGEPEDARDELAAAAQLLEAMQLKPELWQVIRVNAWCAARLGNNDEERRAVQQAERLLQELAGSLQGAERAIFLLNKWTADEEYLAHEIAELVNDKAALADSSRLLRPAAWLRMARRLNRLLVRIDHYRALVAQTAVGAGTSEQRPPGDTVLLQRLLSGDRRRIFLSFLVLPDRILVIRSGYLVLDFHVVRITRIALREQVRRWHEQAAIAGTTRDLGAAPPGGPAASEPVRESEMPLADALELPALLAALPARTRSLTIVPDDALHGFPFAAIEIGRDRLIDRFAVSVSFASMPSRHRPARAIGDALLVAVSKGTGRIPPLPETRAEVKQVEEWLDRRGVKSHVLIDDAATKSRITALFGQVGLCHLACHGTFVPDKPDASGMVLIPEEEPEVLSLRDLSRLELTTCQHVTLSSCWSADNFILPGRWIVSLPETLHRSGAPSILACAWPVHDEVAKCFTARFYVHLAEMSPLEALRHTQLECRAAALPECGVDTSHPFHWAGFSLFGDAVAERLQISGSSKSTSQLWN
jgi:hypothetical protein